MAKSASAALRKLPSVDEVLRTVVAEETVERFGRAAMVAAVREVLAQARAAKTEAGETLEVAGAALTLLEAQAQSNLRPVFNLTGTVLHTNLGRALLAEAAIEAATIAMRNAVALEFDLGEGHRGDRDEVVRDLLCELTGAEDATVVNNNAAAVLLVLNTLGKGREAIVSRGELIEIGGAFRMPEIMSRAGAKLVEVGTTNRTHPKDYSTALNPRTGIVLKVHTSNYRIQGFTAEVAPEALAELAHAAGVPLVHDLGSGTLVDLARYGLQKEPTVREAVAHGADIVTFSGDKLLGGPQAGIIVGKRTLLAEINRNPMKRALRVDKIRLAAFEATLKLYRDPDRLAERLPTLRLLARAQSDIRAQAQRIQPAMAEAVGPAYSVALCDCVSQIGSGALPLETVPSAGLSVRTTESGGLERLAALLRGLRMPILGRIEDDFLKLDMRCLTDEVAFLDTLSGLERS